MTTPTLPAGLNLSSPILSLVAGLLPPPFNTITQTLLPRLPQIIAMAEADVAIVKQIEAAPDVPSKLAILAAHFQDVGAQLQNVVEAIGGIAHPSTTSPPAGGTAPSPLPSSPAPFPIDRVFADFEQAFLALKATIQPHQNLAQ